MWIVTGVLGGVLALMICGVFYRVVRYPPKPEEIVGEIKPEPVILRSEPISVSLDDYSVSSAKYPDQDRFVGMQPLDFNKPSEKANLR